VGPDELVFGSRSGGLEAFLRSPEGQALTGRFGHTLAPTGEIGAATGIEFLDDGRVVAAAEPERRGGGSAMVEEPE